MSKPSILDAMGTDAKTYPQGNADDIATAFKDALRAVAGGRTGTPELMRLKEMGFNPTSDEAAISPEGLAGKLGINRAEVLMLYGAMGATSQLALAGVIAHAQVADISVDPRKTEVTSAVAERAARSNHKQHDAARSELSNMIKKAGLNL